MSPQHPNPTTPKAFALSPSIVLHGLLVVGFGVALIQTAWIGDDARITLRGVLNLTNGFGPSFNVAERVQANVHPLWFFAIYGTNLIVRNIFTSTLILGIGATIAALLGLATRVSIRWESGALALTVLLFSQAFVDYSTSGLENPLAHLLLVAFVVVFLRVQNDSAKLRHLVGLASLIYLTRHDLILLVVPCLVIATVRHDRLERVPIELIWGAAPAAAWSVFSVFYYGSLFPNVAYAKLGAAVPTSWMIGQGLHYFADSLARDPVTLIAIASALLVALVRRSLLTTSLAFGLLLYLPYVVYAGGGFMAGRFFATPVFCAALIIARIPATAGWRFAGGAVGVIALGCLGTGTPPVLSPADYSDTKVSKRGITDERGYYFKWFGLVSPSRGPFYHTDWPTAEDRPNHSRPVEVEVVGGGLGVIGMRRGPDTHLLDNLALADPLLARLPAKPYSRKIGHFERSIPDGYVASLRNDTNAIVDEDLKEFYEALRLITRGPLFSTDRLGAIFRLNTGYYTPLLDAYIQRLRVAEPPNPAG